ncbi:hypothetical protein HOK51_11585 [Candidatus Woesearchaeota archaeon]|mgnify:FL=1|jgi:HTH-type transcriptional regulator, sugar sensing transcriptional regulator|nr:hypothetical protein [Candidatus Woesearchaeota archaeon]MBT6520463.1 hypothetical protein [Candidatus Woesearchaeota archaeon]MBT7368575.1 hypothetical protein [Candidatus Woesearchaeota archaeon]
MYLKELEEVGFTPREIKVYTALLEIGESSVGAIIKKSGIPSSKIYETLNKLKSSGLVSTIIKQNKQFFSANSPDTILDHLDQQRNRLAETTIPKLNILQTQKLPEKESKVYEGTRGVKSIYELMLRTLKKGETLRVMGAPLKAQEVMAPFLKNFNSRRVKSGIKMKILYEEDSKEYAKIRKKLQHTQVKYLKSEHITPAWVDIFGDYISIFDVKDKPTAFLIKDKNIADSFKNYFDLIWKQAKNA